MFSAESWRAALEQRAHWEATARNKDGNLVFRNARMYGRSPTAPRERLLHVGGWTVWVSIHAGWN